MPELVIAEHDKNFLQAIDAACEQYLKENNNPPELLSMLLGVSVGLYLRSELTPDQIGIEAKTLAVKILEYRAAGFTVAPDVEQPQS